MVGVVVLVMEVIMVVAVAVAVAVLRIIGGMHRGYAMLVAGMGDMELVVAVAVLLDLLAQQEIYVFLVGRVALVSTPQRMERWERFFVQMLRQDVVLLAVVLVASGTAPVLTVISTVAGEEVFA